MPEQPAKGKSGRRPVERRPSPPTPAVTQPAPAPPTAPAPAEATPHPEPRAPHQSPATAETNGSVLREQPAVAYALAFALLALLLLCAFSIYMAAR